MVGNISNFGIIIGKLLGRIFDLSIGDFVVGKKYVVACVFNDEEKAQYIKDITGGEITYDKILYSTSYREIKFPIKNIFQGGE
jgi:hypothetical protein